MGWSIVGVSNVVEVTGTAHALVTTGITGLQRGDLLVACIASRIASNTAITEPSAEWTRTQTIIQNNTATNTSAAATAYQAFCIRGAADPALTFTHPIAPSVAIGRIVAYRGIIKPLDILTQQSNGSATATNTTSCVWTTGLTGIIPGELIVAMVAGGQEATWSVFDAVTTPSVASGASDTTTAPTVDTWIERADSSTTTGADTSLAIFDGIVAAGQTATGNLSATASLAASHSMILTSFRYEGIPDLTMAPMLSARR